MTDTHFHRDLVRYSNFSEKLKIELKATTEQVLQHLKDLDKKIQHQVLLTLTNRFVSDIFNVIRDLQDVAIKTDEEKKSNQELEDIVRKLSQHCNEIVLEYDNKFDILKQKLEAFVKQIFNDGDTLLNVIRRDDFQNFKHELIEAFKDIVHAIQIVQATIEIQNLDKDQLHQQIEKVKKEFFDDITIIERANPENLKELKNHIASVCKNIFVVGHYLCKSASNYDGEIQLTLLDASKRLNTGCANFLFGLDNPKNSQEALDTLRKFSIECWGAVLDLYNFVDRSFDNKKAYENLRLVIIFTVIFGTVCNLQVGKIAKYITEN